MLSSFRAGESCGKNGAEQIEGLKAWILIFNENLENKSDGRGLIGKKLTNELKIMLMLI